jgi:hypothetical protein
MITVLAPPWTQTCCNIEDVIRKCVICVEVPARGVQILASCIVQAQALYHVLDVVSRKSKIPATLTSLVNIHEVNEGEYGDGSLTLHGEVATYRRETPCISRDDLAPL